MKGLVVKNTVVNHYSYNDIPVMGNGATWLNNVKGWLKCNWQGHVISYSQETPSDFVPTDKGGLSAFGLDEKGKVILGMALYEGDESTTDPIQKGVHYLCLKMNETNCSGE